MMKKFLYTPLILIVTLMGASPVVAETLPRVLITQIQTGSKLSVSEEFISLYNDSDTSLDASLYAVEYSSASSGTSWSKKATLSGLWYPHTFYLLASSNYLADKTNTFFSAGLAKTGGHIRIVKTDSGIVTLMDIVGWGTAVHPEKSAAYAPLESAALERKVSADGLLIDTDNNANDFVINTMPEPQSTNVAPIVNTVENATTVEIEKEIPVTVEAEPTVIVTQNSFQEQIIASADTVQNLLVEQQVATPQPEEFIVDNIVQESSEVETLPEDTAQNALTFEDVNSEIVTTENITSQDEPLNVTPTFYGIKITELYPNPIAPETDEKDEFVELYNPNDVAVDVSGYRIQTGESFSHNAVLGFVIKPKSYWVINAGGAKVPLSNSGGRARLLAPDGAIIDETTHYASAKAGESWSVIDGQWVWSTLKTPGEENRPSPIPIQNLATVVAPKTMNTVRPKSVPLKKISSLKSAALPKINKTSATKVKSASPAKKSMAQATPAKSQAKSSTPTTTLPIHPKVLAGVGLLAVGYAVYEYREDIRTRIWKLRRNYRIRQEIGQKS